MTTTILPNGLYAAAITPFVPDPSAVPAIDFTAIPLIVEHLIADGITGIYVCGSTGEGVSLSTAERRRVLEEYVLAAAGRLRVLVQVGHNSLAESLQLTAHAAELGVDAISATCPSYFSVETAPALVRCMKPIAQTAPNQPFFYYHIPALTGSQVSIADFAQLAVAEIGNFAGLKYTTAEIHQFMELQNVKRPTTDECLQVFWGTDEMLLPAFCAGAESAIGSTYNVAAPHSIQLLDDLHKSDIGSARSRQLQAIQMVRVMQRHSFLPALKTLLGIRLQQRFPDFELSNYCRAPLESSRVDAQKLTTEIDSLGIAEFGISASDPE
ncbi:MAG: dihydrodipicolinate synthase family protein [Aureliella sp.]